MIINGVCPLKLLDGNQFILAQAVGVPAASIDIAQGNNPIKTFRPLSVKNIILSSDETFAIGSTTYKKIEKIGDDYFFNYEKNGKLETAQIKIIFASDYVVKITK